MTLVSHMGDVIRHTRTVLIGQTGDGKMVFMWNEHRLLFRSLNEFCNRWCKREHVECDALKDWKLNIFKIIDRRISFYSQNTNMLSRKPKISDRYLKSGIKEFHRKYV